MMRSFVAVFLGAAIWALAACETAPPEPGLAIVPQPTAPAPIAPAQAPAAAAPTAEIDRAQQTDSQPAAADVPTLDESQLSSTPRGLVLTLEDATFDSDRAIIKPAARRGLDALAQFLHENPGRRVQIEAFTDSEGSSVYNLELSQDRADAVALAVMARGVEGARVRAIGWGERYPVADNDSEQSRARNRRVEIIVSKEDAAVPVRVVSGP